MSENKSQIKSGNPITLIQLIVSVVVLFGTAVGLYTTNQVQNSKRDDRITQLEKQYIEDKSERLSKRAEWTSAKKDIDERVDKNTQAIEILKVTKKDR